MSRYENEDGVVTEASDGVVAYLAQVTPDQEREVGVGPWQGPWPEGDHWDHELLEHGDRRNVVDPYRYWNGRPLKPIWHRAPTAYISRSKMSATI